jgi:hypothetical protein
MKNNNIGYIILEDGEGGYRPESTVVKQSNYGNSNKVLCEAIFQSADTKNRNGRFYLHEELFREIASPRTKELISVKALKSEQGHPQDTSLARQTVIWEPNCSCIILSLRNEGNDIKGTFTTTSNNYGKALDEEIRDGYIPAFSLRALGSIVQSKNGAEVRGLRLITYDQVIYPSHPNAYMTGILKEDGSESIAVTEAKIIPVTDECVIKYIQSESANLKFIKECFDYRYDSIKLNENKTKVLLTTNEGDTLVINLESYIHNELMKYSTKEF